MAFKDTCDGCGSDQSYLVFARVVKLSDCSINIRHKELLSLTKKGRKYIGLDEEQTDRHGGVVHKFWVEKIAGLLRTEGYSVQTEASIGDGRTVDILARRNALAFVFEIETGASDIKTNIQKCHNLAIDRVYIVGTSKETKPGSCYRSFTNGKKKIYL